MDSLQKKAQSLVYYIQILFYREKKDAWQKTQQELVFAAPPKKINQSIKQNPSPKGPKMPAIYPLDLNLKKNEK